MQHYQTFSRIDKELQMEKEKATKYWTCTRFWWESPKERDHRRDQGIGGKMGSEWILGRLAWGVWIEFN
jgi:hypothetical protein